ncbi:MAG: sugar ABC transporter ATP-binding protein [Alphaproteobacteria bacterium]|nr:MAG: sugar ABC transporter ATP-binding protein [Alphaproteobacteria bacterium]
MAELILKDITKDYGDGDVIKGINLRIPQGEFCVFVGPSGCGKSTLLRMISGLEDVTSGAISLDGKDITKVHAADRGMAMVFQSYALYPHMRVRENLSFALENINTPKDEIIQRVGAAAKMLQIEGILDRKPTTLSGGQRQRVAIGRSVVREPKVFLFDEPLSNLDAELRVQMRDEITRLHKRIGNTMIYVTHDQIEAMTMADRIVVLHDGVIEQSGSPLELYDRPCNIFVAGFIGAPRMNFIEMKVTDVKGDHIHLEHTLFQLRIPAGKHHVSIGQEVTLGVRANHLEISETDNADVIGVIERVENLGAESHVYARLASGEGLTVYKQGYFEAGDKDKIGVKIVHNKLHLFDTDSGGSIFVA